MRSPAFLIASVALCTHAMAAQIVADPADLSASLAIPTEIDILNEAATPGLSGYENLMLAGIVLTESDSAPPRSQLPEPAALTVAGIGFSLVLLGCRRALLGRHRSQPVRRSKRTARGMAYI